jgi:deoxyribonuclease (pyrimidine dimer)
VARINLVPPSELMDQHLFAEFREIKMVPKSLRRSIAARGVSGLVIPERFTLNRGHVSFFYDKGAYLVRRYEEIKEELRVRGFNFNELSPLDPDGVFDSYPELRNDYEPTAEALETVRERIREKIGMRPGWYRYRGKARTPV